MTIRTRLLVTYLVLTGAAMLVLAGATLFSFHRFFWETTRADLDARATAVSQSVSDWLEQNNIERAGMVVKRYGAQAEITLRVFDPKGQLLATSEKQDDWAVPWLGAVATAQAAKGQRVAGIEKSPVDGSDRFYEARPLIRGGKLFGVLRMSRTTARFQKQMRLAVTGVVGLVLVVFAVAALVCIRLARNMATPIQKMRNFAVDLGKGQFPPGLEIRREDELGQLAVELNRMCTRLAALDGERRAFIASASHELRTPISNVQVTLEALESGAINDPELSKRFLQTALQESNRMTILISDLLYLGRLEAGVLPIEHRNTSLRHLVTRVSSAMESRFRLAKVELEADKTDAPLSVDVERMLQALLNIVDNALKFSPPGSTIHVYSRIEDGKAFLSFRDEGPGISTTDLPHVFEQFYSADPARKGEGTGLGLAIARKIIEGHGGTIAASSPPGEGATFTITLPLRETEPLVATN